jgi:hypothetical protein
MYNSLYIAKVIYDTDRLKPEQSRPYGRVYVKILGIDQGDSAFQASQGSNNPNKLTPQELEIVGQTFPADVMQPVFGGGSGTTYNADKDLIGVQDTGDIEDETSVPQAESYFDVSDEFIGVGLSVTSGVNPTAQAYSPDNRSNSYKGMLSYPRKDSTVIVSFLNGLRGNPIILGYYVGEANFDSIASVGNGVYPNTPYAYSNLTDASLAVEDSVTLDDSVAVEGDDYVEGPYIPSDFSKDYSDLPPNGLTKKSIDDFLKYNMPDLAEKLAADYRRRERELRADRVEVISLIREEVGDAAAKRAITSFETFDRENPSSL